MNFKLRFEESMLVGFQAAVMSAIINAILFYVFHAADVITDGFLIEPNEKLTVIPVII